MNPHYFGHCTAPPSSAAATLVQPHMYHPTHVLWPWGIAPPPRVWGAPTSTAPWGHINLPGAYPGPPPLQSWSQVGSLTTRRDLLHSTTASARVDAAAAAAVGVEHVGTATTAPEPDTLS